MSGFIKNLLRARLFGHPIHSMIAHFPSALFPTSLLFDIISIFIHDHCLSCAAFYCLAAGLAFGIIAACVGAIDYSHLSANHPAWNKASLHALLNVTWLILFSIVFGLKMKHFPTIEFATPTQLVIDFISVIGLVYSNYLGGELVFHHKLGFDDTKE